MESEKIISLIQGYISETSTDLFLFSGHILYSTASDFVDTICKKENPHPTALLYICTPGGDPHAAYRIIRALRAKYKTVRLAIAGPCKSAGTLIAIGAHSLSMAETGELGPLDVQLSKPDEIIPNSSGLDIFQALAVTTRQAFETFEQSLLDLVEHSSGSISTKTAAELAGDLVVGLFAPVMAQIDPHRLGEVQRAIRIAQAYGEKIGTPKLKPNGLERLVEQYPSHGFVIDFDEAKQLFLTVERLDGVEREIYAVFRPLFAAYYGTPDALYGPGSYVPTTPEAGDQGCRTIAKPPSRPAGFFGGRCGKPSGQFASSANGVRRWRINRTHRHPSI